ncbi:MAG TPA: DUF2269 family protein [Gaiellaceae bacterium]|nr:DUF2269 family protein [Gaiellaceae bacterium]
MSWYELLLFAHISMAVVWIGGALMMQFFGMRAGSSGDPERVAHLGEDIEWIGLHVFVPASLLAFATGILLVVESDAYGLGDDWIVIGLAVWAVSFLAGVLFFGPESGRVGALVRASSPEAGSRMARLILLTRLELVLLFGLVYDMAVKPDLDDASSLLWGALGMLGAGALVLWRHASRPAPAAAP